MPRFDLSHSTRSWAVADGYLLRVLVLRVLVLRLLDDFLRELLDLRPPEERLRAAARPPLRPAWTTEGALRPVDFLRLLVDFFLVLVDLRPVLFLLDEDFLRPSVDLRPVLLRPVLFLPVEDFLRPPVDFFRAVARPPFRPAWTTEGALRPVDFFRPDDFLRPLLDLRPVLFLLEEVDLRPVLFLLEEVFLRPVDFLRVPEAVPLELFRPVAFLRPPDDLVPVDLRVLGAPSPAPP
jgi:hypothetical protein